MPAYALLLPLAAARAALPRGVPGVRLDAPWRPDLAAGNATVPLQEGVAYLREMLQLAVQVEHGVLPPYLTALYSLTAYGQDSVGDAAALMRSVAIDEMMHMTNVANLLNAVGGAPVIDRADLVPQWPAQLPFLEFNVSIAPYSAAQMLVFARIEEPAWGSAHFGGNGTIGQFYANVTRLLDALVEQHGEAAVFTGNASWQVAAHSSRGTTWKVTNYTEAKGVLNFTAQQGEGTVQSRNATYHPTPYDPQQRSLAHYYQFVELWAGREFADGDPADGVPTGAPIQPSDAAIADFRANPKAAEYADHPEEYAVLSAFNAAYTDMLAALHETFNGNPARLSTALQAMYKVGGLGRQLLTTPDPLQPHTNRTIGCPWEYNATRSRFRGSWHGIHL